MKTITKCVVIEEEKYVLVYLEKVQKYGTISYNELDEKGCMKRQLNGIEMCLSETIAEAVETRKTNTINVKFIEDNKLDIENIEDLKIFAKFIEQQL